MTAQDYKRGDRITYQREIRFKGTETTTATIVAIYPGRMGSITGHPFGGETRKLQLDNGDEMIAIADRIYLVS